MIVPERLRGALSGREISQAELARRVGVSQQTIAKLVTGSSNSSRYLHRIARELQTSAAYLEGETDDPSTDSPPEFLTTEERAWVELLRALAPDDRKAALQLVHTIATSARSPTVHDKGQGYKSAKEDTLS